MLKLVVVLTVVTTVFADVSHILASGAPPSYPTVSDHPVAILRQEQDLKEDGSFLYSFESENGIAVEEQGLPLQSEDSGTVVSGFYHYSSPEGVPVAIHYLADKNGFQPSGDVLPTPPPISNAILKSLEYNAAHPTEE